MKKGKIGKLIIYAYVLIYAYKLIIMLIFIAPVKNITKGT